MTSQSPRIYIYKITFEEVPYYYYGVHKEKKFDEYYMGSPYTHKWVWDFYTPKKQILQYFDFTDEGWLEAQKVEKRLIKPFYNTDKWCLNEHCGGEFSIEHQKRAGKNGGNRVKELGIGIHSLTSQEKGENAKKAKELGVGIFAMSTDELSVAGKKGGNKTKELGVGVHSQTKEQMTKNGKIGGKIAAKNTNFQKWICLETGFITNPGNLTQYQKRKSIDTSKRKRIA